MQFVKTNQTKSIQSKPNKTKQSKIQNMFLGFVTTSYLTLI